MKPGPYMRKHSTGALRTNPPKLSRFGARATSRTEARPGRRRKSKRAKTATAKRSAGRSGGAVHVIRLGRILAIEYRHHGGGTYRHKFGRTAAELFATRDGDALIIRGRFAVKPFIEDHQ